MLHFGQVTGLAVLQKNKDAFPISVLKSGSKRQIEINNYPFNISSVVLSALLDLNCALGALSSF